MSQAIKSARSLTSTKLRLSLFLCIALIDKFLKMNLFTFLLVVASNKLAEEYVIEMKDEEGYTYAIEEFEVDILCQK